MHTILLTNDNDFEEDLSSALKERHLRLDAFSNEPPLFEALREAENCVVLLDEVSPERAGRILVEGCLPRGHRCILYNPDVRPREACDLFEMGIDDILRELPSISELVARLRAAGFRASRNRASTFHLGHLEVDLGKARVKIAGQPVPVQSVYWRLLECLVRKSPEAVSIDDLRNSVMRLGGMRKTTDLASYIFCHLGHLQTRLELWGHPRILWFDAKAGWARLTEDQLEPVDTAPTVQRLKSFLGSLYLRGLHCPIDFEVLREVSGKKRAHAERKLKQFGDRDAVKRKQRANA